MHQKRQNNPKLNSRLLGDRLRRLRKKRGLSLNEASKMTGVAVSTLSKIENNKMSPTFDVVTRIMSGLEISPAFLFGDSGETTTKRTPTVDRRDKPVFLSIPGADYAILCADSVSKAIFPTIVTLQSAEHHDLVGHTGEEFLIILDGTLEVLFQDETPIKLSKGECLYFDSHTPHSIRSSGSSPVRFLAVSSKSGFDDARGSDNQSISSVQKLRDLILR